MISTQHQLSQYVKMLKPVTIFEVAGILLVQISGSQPFSTCVPLIRKNKSRVPAGINKVLTQTFF